MAKYWDGDAHFSQLIDYFELSGGKKSLVDSLRRYNKQRNMIVHHILEYKSIHDLVKDAKENFQLGREMSTQLIKDAGLQKILNQSQKGEVGI